MEDVKTAADSRWYGPDCDITKRHRPSPAELESLRPRPGTPQAGAVDEAAVLAHRAGSRELEPVIRRLITAERTIAELTEKITNLETQLIEVKYPVNKNGKLQR